MYKTNKQTPMNKQKQTKTNKTMCIWGSRLVDSALTVSWCILLSLYQVCEMTRVSGFFSPKIIN